jgi:hypothetical protein
VPRHVRPSGHGGVSGAPDDDGQRMNGEGASDAGDWDAGEQRREARARGAASDRVKGMARQPDKRAVGEGARQMNGHVALGVRRISIRGCGDLFFCL